MYRRQVRLGLIEILNALCIQLDVYLPICLSTILLPTEENVNNRLCQSRDSLRDLVGSSPYFVSKFVIRDIVEIWSCFLGLPCGERKDAWVC